jgi:hypothetical protein
MYVDVYVYLCFLINNSWAGDVAQLVEQLPSMLDILVLIPSEVKCHF